MAVTIVITVTAIVAFIFIIIINLDQLLDNILINSEELYY